MAVPCLAGATARSLQQSISRAAFSGPSGEATTSGSFNVSMCTLWQGPVLLVLLKLLSSNHPRAARKACHA